MRDFLLAWALIGALLAGIISIIVGPEYQRLERIRENQATVNGFEIGANCDLDSRGFAYVVNGKTYLWRRSFAVGFTIVDDQFRPSSVAGGDCHDNIGAPIIVYYERSNPAHSIAADPYMVILNDLIFVVFVALAVPPIMICSFRDWRARGMPWI